MSTYRKPERGDWLKTIAYIVAYLLVIGTLSFYLLLSYWYIWVVLVIGGLFFLVSWHARSTAYHCPQCGHDFEISPVTDFVSPHGVDQADGGWKYLKCPYCSTRT